VKGDVETLCHLCPECAAQHRDAPVRTGKECKIGRNSGAATFEKANS
jgi:hypothetical protein